MRTFFKNTTIKTLLNILTNIFSNDFFANQQFKNTGINKLTKGRQKIYKTE